MYARWQDEQKAYQEQLAKLPVLPMPSGLGVGGGGDYAPNTPAYLINGKGGTTGNGNVIDPTTWAATVDAIKNGTLSAMGVLTTIEDGGSYKGMDTHTMREAALYSMSPETYGQTYQQTARNYNSAHNANHGGTRANSTGGSNNSKKYDSNQQRKDLGY